MIPSLANHLLQSTVFVMVAGILTLLLRQNHARTRYWIWLVASIKFVVPFSLFVEIGHRVSWSSAPAITKPGLAIVMDEISQPFITADVSNTVAIAPSIWPLVLLVAWICGCCAVLIFWLVRWRRVAATLRTGVPIREGRELLALRRFDANIELISSPSELEPGVFGIVRPVLSLPAGISDHLSDEQLDAVVAHELCHVRCRDNFTAMLHMLVEAIFWFHPLVWWTGARLVEERERACDEEVVRLGSDPEVYAESILRICRFYLASPLDCAAGISGSDLRKRIEEIMTHPILNRLSFGKKVMLGAMGVAALMTPVAVGVFTAPVVRAQAKVAAAPAPSAARLEFETASIKPLNMTVAEAFQAGHLDWHIDDAMADLQGATLISLMQFAWHVPQNQITNAQGWMNSVTFDVRGKLPAGSTKGQVPAMLQSLLADRFKLAVHHQSEIRPAYELTVGNKLNLTPSVAPDPLEKNKCKDDTGQRVCRNMTMPELANLLSGLANMQALRGAVGDVPDWTIDRPVVDMTNLSGAFDFPLDYGRNASSRGNGQVVNIRDSINSLGLKLVPAKLPFDVIFIDHADRVPTGN